MKILSLTLVLSLAVGAFAAPRTFRIDSDKLAYRNVATVESESDFETFTGRTNAVSGTIQFDPTKRTGSGTISVDVDGIDTGIAMRNEHMKGPMWLDAAKYPKITFATTGVKSLGGDLYQVTGNLSLHGVTRRVVTKARVRYRAYGPEVKQVGFDGDVLQISTKFPIRLSDYGIKITDMVKGKVSNEVTIGISTYAVAR